MEASGIEELSWLMIACPLFGAAVLLLGGRRTNGWGHWLGVLTPIVSFGIAVAVLLQMIGQEGDERTRYVDLFTFFDVGNFKVDMGLQIDPLSITFALLITGVGALIHIYSVGYMSEDPERRRFFAYLNLFVAAMLLLVLADNYVGLYIGWEGVGLASYLLIGFWQFKPTAATAAKKAFVVNRVGDFGLSVAIMLMFATFGTVSFQEILGGHGEKGLIGNASETTITVLGLLLLLGACGKSAQLPLQSWLLDAMEGPTPVSALIHAATMVTAGVYLIVRSNAIFELSPDAQLAVVIVGAATLVAGALIGCAKDDIKKALAGSTMSQIGYMHLAAGLGRAGYVFAIAHLVVHGFFKAGLFLGAGSVMHGMKDDVNMRKYGALRKIMPITYITMMFGWLAILGIPPFSGFFTKEGIIAAAFDEGGSRGAIFGSIAVLGAAITAYYMSRLFFMTFYGAKRWDEGIHPHESPKVMTWPLLVLALGSVFGGLLLIEVIPFANFLEPVVGEEEGHHALVTPEGVATLALVLVGAVVAWLQYGRRPVPREVPVASWPVVAARKDLYGDALNEALFMRPGQWMTRIMVYLDNRGVDGVVNGLAAFTGGTSGRLRRLQTGFVRTYALSMFFGATLVVGALLVVKL